MRVRHTTIGSFAVVAILAVGLTGCGGGSTDDPGSTSTGTSTDTSTDTGSTGSDPTASPTPVVYTSEQLQAALPTEAELGDYTTVTVCPGGDDCGSESVSISANNPGDDTTWGLGTNVWVTFTPVADEAAATAAVQPNLDEAELKNGEFNILSEDLPEEEYNPGQRGSGTMTDVAEQGWSGVRSTAVYTLIDPDDEVSESPLSEAKVALTRGNAVLEVGSIVAGDDLPGAEEMLDTLLATTLDKLAS